MLVTSNKLEIDFGCHNKIFLAHFSFSLDNQWIGTIPTGDGYFKRGHFTGYNPWENGGLDAPFDQEVL